MNISFDSKTGLVPAIIQDANTRVVLMLGYMNKESFLLTKQTGKVTFYSRSRKQIWTKGETSGNYLKVKEIELDCDSDALLIKAEPMGVVCHTGSDTCWNEVNRPHYGFIDTLESIIKDRHDDQEQDSYTSNLFKNGINKIAQKVGEEAVEVVIEAKDDNRNLFLNESADLLFHYLILLRAKGCSLEDVIKILEIRHNLKN